MTADPPDVPQVGRVADDPPLEEDPPARGGVAWVGFALSAAGFLVSVLAGDQGSMLLAVLGLAFGITGLVRAYRRTAGNAPVALVAVVLALLTFAVSAVWYLRSQPCTPLRPNLELFQQCIERHSGVL